MTAFEYASGLISIVVGLGIARVLGGIGSFIESRRRSAGDWIAATSCLVLLLALVAWWIAGWQVLRAQAEISLATLVIWTLATALYYLAAYLLVPGTIIDGSREQHANSGLPSRSFFLCLAAHFGLMLVYAVVVGVIESSLGFIITASLVVVSGAGAAVRSNRSRVFHLLVWATLLAVILNRADMTIG